MGFKQYKKYFPPALFIFFETFSTYAANLSKLIRSKAPRTASRRASRPKSRAKAGQKKTSLKDSFNILMMALVVAAFSLAALGQVFIAQPGQANLQKGLLFYFFAVVIFLFALRPWKYESLQRAPLSPGVEGTLFGLILAVAAFLRIYRLDTVPNGIFMDQGFEGWGGMTIAHEGWKFPLFVDQPLYAPSYLLYNLGIWFKFFQPTQFNLFLFFACLALAAFPLMYWFFRQLMGPRVALLALFLLAVMRWHINFSRNGFPTIEVPFYMFGTLSFLLYGYRSEKRWPFCVAAVFCSLGYYTYQAFKLFPLLVVVYAVYEFLVDRKKFKRNLRSTLVFGAIFLVMVSPILYNMIQTRSFGSREDSNNIWGEIRNAHSLKPVVHMVTKTLLMCNREGDDNERHNIPNHRMMDDVSGALFFLGFFYACARFRRRKYFYALSGLFVMSLPCLLSVVPAHANRMLGVTAFVCFLTATPLAALWGRVRQRWGTLGELCFLLLLVEPLVLITYQNYNIYFNVQPKDGGYWNTSFWGGYSYDASLIGKEIARDGDAYEYYLDRRHYTHTTVKFLAYNQWEHVHQLDIPAGFSPIQANRKRGLFFAFLSEQEGYLRMIQSLYPHCQVEKVKNPSGQTLVYFVKVPPSDVLEGKGLTASYQDGNVEGMPGFPDEIPAGPFNATLTGCIYLDKTDTYEFQAKTNGQFSWSIGGHPILPGNPMKFLKGFYRVQMSLRMPAEKASLELSAVTRTGKTISLDNTRFTRLEMARGLKGSYFDGNSVNGVPVFQEWEPFINFYSTFPYTNWKESAVWEGKLEAPSSGNYLFMAKTDEWAKVLVDGKEVVVWGHNPSGSVFLRKGGHRFLVQFQKDLGPSLVLYWKPPDSKVMEVVPNWAFGFTE